MLGTDKGRCPSPWLPSTPSEFCSSLEGSEDSSPCLPGGWQSSAAVPACCLADGEIISKPFPFPPPLLLQDHTGCPRGTQYRACR